MSTLQQQNRLPFWNAEQFLLVPVIALLSAVWIVNYFFAKLKGNKALSQVQHQSLSGHDLVLREFGCGLWKKSFVVWEIMCGKVSIVGMPLDSGETLRLGGAAEPGLVSLWQLRRLTGLSEAGLYETVAAQLRYTRSEKIRLFVKYCLARCLYQNSKLREAASFKLFGIWINNVTMKRAVELVTAKPVHASPRVGFFVNVNSFNLAHDDDHFKQVVNSGDFVFADGSGIRLAARVKGIALKDNVNGTDMLPPLCESVREKGLSIYLLGADHGVAETAAAALTAQFPGLRIAGTHHGYISATQSKALVKQINAAGTDILLVGMGSPIQEQWLCEHAHLLRCRSALAVGGLFDFFSGRIPRAPLWMRELGLEWVWRLVQDPKAKFHRYVIGNPRFLIRLSRNS